MIDIKFIPTGNVFSLPDEEAERIVKEDRGNYEVVKGHIKEAKVQETKKTVKDLVVVDKNKKDNKTSKETKKQNKEVKEEKKEEISETKDGETQKEETPKE